jgi:hypothetical protein
LRPGFFFDAKSQILQDSADLLQSRTRIAGLYLKKREIMGTYLNEDEQDDYFHSDTSSKEALADQEIFRANKKMLDTLRGDWDDEF